MKKYIIYISMGIIALFLLYACPPGSPEYLYRCLDIRCYELLNQGGWSTCDTTLFVEMKKIHWTDGVDDMANGYYKSNNVDDDLYGFFSMPVRMIKDTVILDSIILNIYTQGNEDFININLKHFSMGVSVQDFAANNAGNGLNGWQRINFMDAAGYALPAVETVDSCYRFQLDCTNNGGPDIRVGYCVELKYHIQ